MAGIQIGNKIVMNKNVKGCFICQNPRIHTIVDPMLFEAKNDLKTIKLMIENDYQIFVELNDLREHRGHIFCEDVNINTDIENEINNIKKVSNIDIINEELAKLRVLENRIIDSGNENSVMHDKLRKEKRELLTMKAKIEGEIKEVVDVNVLPSWIKKIEE